MSARPLNSKNVSVRLKCFTYCGSFCSFRQYRSLSSRVLDKVMPGISEVLQKQRSQTTWENVLDFVFRIHRVH